MFSHSTLTMTHRHVNRPKERSYTLEKYRRNSWLKTTTSSSGHPQSPKLDNAAFNLKLATPKVHSSERVEKLDSCPS